MGEVIRLCKEAKVARVLKEDELKNLITAKMSVRDVPLFKDPKCLGAVDWVDDEFCFLSPILRQQR